MPMTKKGARTGSTDRSERSRNLLPTCRNGLEDSLTTFPHGFGRFLWHTSVTALGALPWMQRTREENDKTDQRTENTAPETPGELFSLTHDRLFVLCSAPGRNRPLHPPPVQPALPVAASRLRTTPQPRLAPLDYTRPRSRRQVFSLASAAARAPDSRPLPGDHPWAQTTTRGSLRSLPCACQSRKGGSTI